MSGLGTLTKAYLLDTTNAFIGSKLDKQIFIEIPKGLPKNLLPQGNISQDNDYIQTTPVII